MTLKVLNIISFKHFIDYGISPEMAFTTRRSIRITNFIALIGASLSGFFVLTELALYLLGKKNIEFSLGVDTALMLLLIWVPIIN